MKENTNIKLSNVDFAVAKVNARTVAQQQSAYNNAMNIANKNQQGLDSFRSHVSGIATSVTAPLMIAKTTGTRPVSTLNRDFRSFIKGKYGTPNIKSLASPFANAIDNTYAGNSIGVASNITDDVTKAIMHRRNSGMGLFENLDTRWTGDRYLKHLQESGDSRTIKDLKTVLKKGEGFDNVGNIINQNPYIMSNTAKANVGRAALPALGGGFLGYDLAANAGAGTAGKVAGAATGALATGVGYHLLEKGFDKAIRKGLESGASNATKHIAKVAVGKGAEEGTEAVIKAGTKGVLRGAGKLAGAAVGGVFSAIDLVRDLNRSDDYYANTKFGKKSKGIRTVLNAAATAGAGLAFTGVGAVPGLIISGVAGGLNSLGQILQWWSEDNDVTSTVEFSTPQGYDSLPEGYRMVVDTLAKYDPQFKGDPNKVLQFYGADLSTPNGIEKFKKELSELYNWDLRNDRLVTPYGYMDAKTGETEAYSGYNSWDSPYYKGFIPTKMSDMKEGQSYYNRLGNTFTVSGISENGVPYFVNDKGETRYVSNGDEFTNEADARMAEDPYRVLINDYLSGKKTAEEVQEESKKYANYYGGQVLLSDAVSGNKWLGSNLMIGYATKDGGIVDKQYIDKNWEKDLKKRNMTPIFDYDLFRQDSLGNNSGSIVTTNKEGISTISGNVPMSAAGYIPNITSQDKYNQFAGAKYDPTKGDLKTSVNWKGIWGAETKR